MDTATSTNHSLKGITSTNDDPDRCAICTGEFPSGIYNSVSRLTTCCGKRSCCDCCPDDENADSCCRFCGHPSRRNIGSLKRNAKRGRAWAQDLLADLYLSGIGVSRSYFDALRWCRKASALGHPMAMCTLGLFLTEGVCCSQDLFAAENCLRKAMEIDEKLTNQCQRLLVDVGVLHGRDREDLATSVSILLPLAELNVPFSRHNLGIASMYAGNFSVALGWLTLAALEGDNMSANDAMECCVELKLFSQSRFWLSLTTKNLREVLSKSNHPKADIEFISSTRSWLRDLRNTCGGCGAPLQGTMRKKCGGCKTYCYCNRDCQKAHWNRPKDGHRGECKGVMELKDKMKEARAKKSMSEK